MIPPVGMPESTNQKVKKGFALRISFLHPGCRRTRKFAKLETRKSAASGVFRIGGDGCNIPSLSIFFVISGIFDHFRRSFSIAFLHFGEEKSGR
jgi:hypothetical protein